jgi:hypothetical protein
MAYEFNGTDESLSLDATKVVVGNSGTICAWVYPTATPTAFNSIFWRIRTTAGSFNSPAIALGAGNQIVLSVQDGSNSNLNFVSSNNAAPNNQWTHVSASWDQSDGGRIYINGGADGTAATSGTINVGTTHSQTIGARVVFSGSAFDRHFAGRVAVFAIYSVVLTAAEIASLAKGMTCDKIRPQNLVFYAPLVRDLIDQKGGLTITNNNAATVAAHTRVYA